MKTVRQVASWAAVVLVAASLQGCQTKPNVRAEYDHAADFANYRTFNFVPQPSTDKMGYSSLVTQELKSAVTAEMEKRGYKLDPDNPDLLVNFSGKLQEKQEIESMPASSVGYYGYRAGYYGTWPGYAMGSEVYTHNYTQGTLNVDVVDAKTKQMVWEGVTIGEVTKKHLENREATIDKAVSNIFAKYPFQAGSASPIKTAEK